MSWGFKRGAPICYVNFTFPCLGIPLASVDVLERKKRVRLFIHFATHGTMPYTVMSLGAAGEVLIDTG